MRVWNLLAVLLAATAGLSACGGEDTDTLSEDLTTRPADRPRLALENVRKALLAGDRETFLDSFHTTADLQGAALQAVWTVLRNNRVYRERMRQTYGQNALDERGRAGVLENFIARKKLSNARLPKDSEITGDRVEARVRGHEHPVVLVRVEGQWKLAAESLAPAAQPEELKRYIAYLQTAGEVLAEAAEEVGQEGLTAADIRRQMHQNLARAMAGIARPEDS